MTTDEKLRNFYESSLQSARDEAQRLMEEKEAAMDKLLQEHKEQKDRQAAEELSAEEKNIVRENNKEVSAKILEIKKQYSETRDRLICQLFSLVEEKLRQYRQTGDYGDLLVKQIRDAQAFAGDDPVSIFVDPSDELLIPVLKTTTNAQISVSDVSLLGGIRAEIPSRNILIDNSFCKQLEDLKENFSLGPDIDGGMSI